MDLKNGQIGTSSISNGNGAKRLQAGRVLKAPFNLVQLLSNQGKTKNKNKTTEKRPRRLADTGKNNLNDNVAVYNHLNYLENFSRIAANGSCNAGSSREESSKSDPESINNPMECKSGGSTGGGDAGIFNSLLPRGASSTLLALNALSKNLQDCMGDSETKKILNRKFRQVEMTAPAIGEYSRKVFIGGLPPDIFETTIHEKFSEFGPMTVDWPHKLELNSIYPPKGYAFLLYNDDASVRGLINACFYEEGRLYICVSSQTMKNKPVQIRPWRLADTDYVPDMHIPLDPRKTVFIGGVPRPIRSYDLAIILNRLFGGVCYAGIDTDTEYKYPKGAGRVTFYSHQCYVAAISARFVQLQHEDIDKRVEIKPYVLDDQQCDECNGKNCNYKYAQFFCSNITCLRYYCDECWKVVHTKPGHEYHKPLVKEGNERPRAIPHRWRMEKLKSRQSRQQINK